MYDPSQPYSSQRSPVAADNLVATSQPLAVEAGVAALRAGGNAVDAALAAAITLTVVEPNNNGVGSDAFAILWDGSELVGLNASGRSPAGWTEDRFAGRQKMPGLGWDTVTVPGAVSAWVELSERYGRLPFAALFEAGIHYARDGFPVGPKTAHFWNVLAPVYERFGHFREHFLPAPQPGARVRRPDLARTLELIAESRGEAFYRGELADAIDAAARAEGGAMRRSDLEAHTLNWVKPVAQSYRGIELHEIPPNGQGLAAQMALGMLEFEAPGALDSIEALHRQIEAMKIAVHAAASHIADIDAMRIGVDELLDADSLRRAASRIGPRATALPPLALPTNPDTVYLTAADRDGMMVSFIQSNFMAFGSGVVIPGTGISMQNRGCGFVTEPGHPNCVGPGKRPLHTIIPGFVTEAGAPRMSFGVMGGPMQPQGHLQMVNRIFDHGQNPQAASDAPRWRVFEDFSVAIETGMPEHVLKGLAELGHSVRYEQEEHHFGGAQLILRTDDAYVGGSDHRKEGMVAGF